MHHFTRISSAIDVEKMAKTKVAIVGNAVSLACDLTRSGVDKLILNDFDRVDFSNIARQDHDPNDVNSFKVHATARKIKQINPAAQVTCITEDCTHKSESEIDQLFAGVGLLVLATDSFAAQAWGNRVALRRNINAMYIGLYAAGRAGEIIFWTPDIDCCLRCLLPKRYDLHHAAKVASKSLDPSSEGATIFDIHLLDAIAGQIAVGLLSRGSDNRYGRLIDQLGDRNFIQLKIAPDWTLIGRDVVREQLGVPEENDAYFAWNAIVRRDPDGGNLPCVDCQECRGVTFEEIDGKYWRRKRSGIEPIPPCVV